jgi:HEAT repeat protein
MIRYLLVVATLFAPVVITLCTAAHLSADGPLPRSKATASGAPGAEAPGGIDPREEKSVPLLTRRLEDKDEVVQLAALDALADIGPRAKTAVPAILKTLRDPKGSVRIRAAMTLLSLDVETETAVCSLLDALKAKDASTRALAALSLGNVVEPPPYAPNDWGPDPPPMIPRPEMAKQFVPVLVEALKDPAVDVRYGAAYGLGRMGSDGKVAVPSLTAALEDKETVVRETAIGALGELGPVAQGAAPALVRVLKDREQSVVVTAACALRRLDPDAFLQSGFPVLIAIIRDDKSKVRQQAVSGIGDLGPQGSVVVPALVEMLKDTDPYVRWAAAQSLGFGPAAKQALSPLIDALHDRDHNVRGMSAFALGRMGPAAEPAVPSLIRALKDDDKQVCRRAAAALGQLGPAAHDAVPALLKALGEDDPELVESAARALGGIGAQADLVVPALVTTLRYKEWSARAGAAAALGAFGEQAKDAVPALIEVLKGDGEYIVLEQAAEALPRVGPQAVDTAVAALIEALKDKDHNIRRTSALSLGLLDADAKSVPDLIRMLREDQDSDGYAAAMALGAMGPKAKSAVPALIEALHADDKSIRQDAGEALRRIDLEAAAKAGVP